MQQQAKKTSGAVSDYWGDCFLAIWVRQLVTGQSMDCASFWDSRDERFAQRSVATNTTAAGVRSHNQSVEKRTGAPLSYRQPESVSCAVTTYCNFQAQRLQRTLHPANAAIASHPANAAIASTSKKLWTAQHVRS